MSTPGNPTADGLEGRIDRTAKATSNIKTIGVALVTAIGTIFAAGVYYSNLQAKLNEYIEKIDKLEKGQAAISQETQNLRNSTNAAFIDLTRIQNVGAPYTNTEPKNSGGGNNAVEPPGRCQLGQVVVGLQPYKDGNGIRSIVMQCGEVPKVKVN